MNQSMYVMHLKEIKSQLGELYSYSKSTFKLQSFSLLTDIFHDTPIMVELFDILDKCKEVAFNKNFSQIITSFQECPEIAVVIDKEDEGGELEGILSDIEFVSNLKNAVNEANQSFGNNGFKQAQINVLRSISEARKT